MAKMTRRSRRHCVRYGRGKGGRRVCKKFAPGARKGAKRRRRRR